MDTGEKMLAVVTGGTRGIGKAICIALKEQGFNVAANYASDDLNANNFTKNTGIAAYKWNVSNNEECHASIQKIAKDFDKPVSVLVNNAGITKDGMLHRMDLNSWNEVISTNLSSCFNMSHACISTMRQEGYGRIISISSINGQAGQVGQTNYAAAKAGILGFTKSLARENAAKGITVNAISPGYIKTEMLECIPRDILEEIIEKIPVKRLGLPEDIARAVLFLASKNASFITGETLSINGGHHMS
jgi:acetoacetyl-CoA reductase